MKIQFNVTQQDSEAVFDFTQLKLAEASHTPLNRFLKFITLVFFVSTFTMIALIYHYWYFISLTHINLFLVLLVSSIGLAIFILNNAVASSISAGFKD